MCDETEDERLEYDVGFRARTDGEPMDTTKTPEWQEGWNDYDADQDKTEDEEF